SMLTFALAHASILALRVKSPDHERPFRLGLNVSVRGRKLPLTAVLGLLATVAVWVVVVVVQPYSRWFGIGWMVVGLAVYVAYRRLKGISLTRRHHAPGLAPVTTPSTKRRPPESPLG
ncbi:MAG: hypothetical protein AB1603_08260, partial [Chloroflexota bacterium]